jgi:hypothetical protein
MARPTHTPTSDQIRRRIDHGGLGDKVDYPDPSAAPLGTDDEAAGYPPSLAEREAASHQPHPAQPMEQPNRFMTGLFAMLLLIVVLAMVILLSIGR